MYDCTSQNGVTVCRVEYFGTYSLNRLPDPEPPEVPLPASVALLSLALGALAAFRRL
jgi:hypothetical protein